MSFCLRAVRLKASHVRMYAYAALPAPRRWADCRSGVRNISYDCGLDRKSTSTGCGTDERLERRMDVGDHNGNEGRSRHKWKWRGLNKSVRMGRNNGGTSEGQLEDLSWILNDLELRSR